LRGNFRRIDPGETTIFLLEGGTRILPSFAESLSRKAAKQLEKLGVKVLTGTRVEKVDEKGVIANGTRIPSATVLWTAGVTASPVVKTLGITTDRSGRLTVDPFLTVKGADGVFAVGDVAALSQNGRPLPGVAQVAIQQGHYVGQVISRKLRGQAPRRPFRYFDKGNMAVVGRNFAVLERGRIRTSGFITWLLWVVVHVMFLPQLQNRLRVQRQWFWSYWTGQRGSRLINETPRSSHDGDGS
jgi:NADH:ubiquinone reductase (H+-translocating)